MRVPAFLSLFLLTASTLPAQTEALIPSKITLQDGTVFEGVKVTGQDAIGISILHDTGTARVAYEQFPKELQAKLGYDPAKAAVQVQQESASAMAMTQEQRAAAILAAQQNQARAKQEAEARLKAEAKAAKVQQQRKTGLETPKIVTPKL